MASSVDSETHDVSHICKVCCDEHDSIAIDSYSVFVANDTIIVRHLNRVSLIRNNKILVTLVYPSNVQSLTLCHQEMQLAMLWVLISTNKLYCSDISRYIFGKSEKEATNVFADLLGDCAAKAELPLVIHVSDDDHCSTLEKTVSDILVTADHIVTLETERRTLSCNIWPKPEPKQALRHAHFTHFITKHDSQNAKLVVCAVEPWMNNEGEKQYFTNRLDKRLYNALFGLDHNLMDSVMVLVGTLSGIVWSISTKTNVRPQQICDLDQPVVAIVCVTAQDTNVCKTITVFGYSGKVMVIRGTDDGLLYQTWFTTSPVLCAITTDNFLIHSTGYGLFVTDIGQLSDDNSPRPCVQATKIHLCHVHHLTAYSDHKGLSVTKGAQVVGLTKNGQLLNVKLDLTRCKNDLATGHDMKELLTSLSTMTHQLTDIQEKLCHQDEVLSQINLASILCARRSSKVFADQPVVSCEVEVKTVNHGSYVSHRISLTLKNTSETVFNEGWKWIVIIQPKKSESHSSQYCMGLGQLKSGEFRTMDISLDRDLLEDLPLRTDFHLIYTNNSHSKTFNLPVWLESKELNILHFLSTSASSQNERSVHNMVINAWKSPVLSTAENSASRNFSTLLSVTRTTCLKATKSSTNEGSNTEALLLKWLLSECDIQLPATSNNVLLRFVENTHLTVHIKTEHQGGFVIHLQSNNVTVLSAASQAITNKLEALQSQHSNEEDKLDNKRLASIIKKINDIQEKCYRLDEVVTEGQDNALTTDKLLELYNNLRQISLPL